MGQSTNGQLCYGIAFEDGFEFPWDVKHEGEIDDWWAFEVHGFRHSVELFDDDGNYLNGVEPSKEASRQYFAERDAFAALHPLPISLINYCSGEAPMFMMAVPSSVHSNRRGYPTVIDPSKLTVTDDEVDALIRFCSAHGISFDDEPHWFLSSYWG